jgi:hypothetical protein
VSRQIAPRTLCAAPPARTARSGVLRRLELLLLATGALVAVTCAIGAGTAAAAAPWWHLSTNVRPANISPGGEGTIVVQAVNLGDAATSGGVTLSDLIPAAYKIQEEEVEGEMVPKVSYFAFSREGGKDNLSRARDPIFGQPLGLCSVTGQVVSCQTEVPAAFFQKSPWDESPFNEPPIRETLEEFIKGSGVAPIQPYEYLEMRISVKDEGASSGALNKAEVKGGSAAAATLERPVQISSTPPAFAAEDFKMVPEEEGGGVDTQAGSHPYQLTTTFALNQSADPEHPPALARNLRFNLPPGLIGNATLLPQCTDLDFRRIAHGGFENLCPADTAVGVASVTVFEPFSLKLVTFPVPLFNLVPANGEPARFGFDVARAPVTLDTRVRTGSDYGVSVNVSNITQLAAFLSSTVTFWGVPGDQSHDSARGWSCLVGGHWTNTGGRELPCVGTSQSHPAPFLTMPSSCALPFSASVEGVSWTSPTDPVAVPLATDEHSRYSLTDEFGRALGVSGCNKLAFNPSIEAQPDVSSASTPTGLSTTVRVPQEVSLGANGLASSSVKDIAVTFPEGVTVNPAGADGLQACSQEQVGFSGFEEFAPVSEPGSKTALFTPTIGSPFCPDASKIATVKIKVPVIAHPLEGSLYLATQNSNPFGSLVAMYIVAEDKESGVLVKLPGQVALDPNTGQLTATFKNSPQAPLESAEIHLFGGARAPLSTPAHCGIYTTNATFTPWSGTPPVTSQSPFRITTGPNGSPCPPAALPFAPTLTAGTTNIQAGAFSPLTTTISRSDGNQDMQSVTLHMPAGLEGLLTGVKLCGEAQANEGTCGAESLIGETIVSAGLGSDPVTVTGGKVYLTEKYAGAPFGLSIVNPVKTGPFDLERDTANPAQQPPCDCVVVRAKIVVDPRTAQLTVTTDASGPHAIPHLIDGIPVQIKNVNVNVNREHFTFNPTSCAPMTLTGAITSFEAASQPLSVPFQATNCANLKFQPKVTVTTAAKATKANGASLNFKIAYPKGAMGSQSWFNEAKFDIPKQLPARLTTIQKACLAATFETNRAACPSASKIGHAIVHTQVLPVPLEGPVYFVSYGAAKFPDAVLVLDGYGVHIELHGETFISSKTGVTSATFRNTPDVPFESIEVNVPTGPFSEFGANLPASAHGSFCGQKLAMPTFFKAQNGLQIKQNTPVIVNGCAKRKALTRKQKLATALKACHKKHDKTKRAACERAARKKYGALRKKKR